MERTGKMILSAVFGALIGLIIAFAVNRLFWWVGLAVGGLAGYLSYDWRTVVQTAGELIGSREDCALVGKKLAASFTVLCWMGGWATALAYPIIYVEYTHTTNILFNLLAAIASICAVCVAVCTVMMFYIIIFSREIDEEDIKEGGMCIFVSSWLIAIVVMLPYGLFLLAKKLPIVGRKIGRFAWRLFILIHSEDRMIVGFSALVGTAGGYITKSFIVGAVIAALSVVFAKHVVAERWLKAKGYIPRR